MKVRNKNILVFGLGKSGNACVKFLLNQGANVFVYDDNKDKLKNYKKNNNINVFNVENLECLDFVIISPGICKSNNMIEEIRRKGILIVSELEFGYEILKNSNIIAITGTNGKTTTTELINEVLYNKYKCFKCGNIGMPFISYVEKITKNDLPIIEVSSFQLEDVLKFKPNIAVITNLGADHLDRYLTKENYWQAKLKIIDNLKEDDFLVVNYEFKDVVASKCKSKIIYFSSKSRVVGAFCEEGKIYFREGENSNSILIMEEKDVHLQGGHNLENVLATICVAMLKRIPIEEIQHTIKSFSAIEHRFEKITTIRGIEFVNDSKATNIDATLKAIEGINCEVHLLLGGSDKGENFDNLFSKLPRNVRVYLFGSTTNKMVNSCISVGFKKFKICANMKIALEKAYESAKRGELVLLSPACASFDTFKNFEERGKYFKEWVYALNEK